MPDLAPLFALGRALAEEAMRTGGTTVRAETRETTVGADTLSATVAATLLFAATPALVVPAGAMTAQAVPNLDLRVTDWQVLVPAATVPPPAGAFVVVEASRDPNLPGTSATVLGSAMTSAGAVLTVYARPVT